jgi:cell division protein FtsQ
LKVLILKKKYPDTLKVRIYEKKPIAILINKKKKYYISETIKLVEYISLKNFKNLPYVLGNEKEFKILYDNLNKINFPFDQIKRFTLYETNRWDLETKNDILIKLPPDNYLESLENFLSIRNKKNIKKYKVFDYRISNQIILK